jgi:hypothetical protein
MCVGALKPAGIASCGDAAYMRTRTLARIVVL